jgi:hypothetical protein
VRPAGHVLFRKICDTWRNQVFLEGDRYLVRYILLHRFSGRAFRLPRVDWSPDICCVFLGGWHSEGVGPLLGGRDAKGARSVGEYSTVCIPPIIPFS